MSLLDPIIQGLSSVLTFFHDLLVPTFGADAWGWAIVLLTLAVRVVLLPLAIKQTTSMRATQRLAPEIKKIQAKYKTDRTMMRSDPEKYRDLRAKQQEETMALYKEHGANPVAGCLPLLAQMPIFFALYNVLNSSEYVAALQDAPFYFVDALHLNATQPGGRAAFALIALMGITTFISQRQTMANNPTIADQPQQKMLLYVMPAVLTVISVNLPVGVLLYWVTTNLWTMGQQHVIFRVAGQQETGAAASPASAAALRSGTNSGTDASPAGSTSSAGGEDGSTGKGAPTPKRNEVLRAKAEERANAARGPTNGKKAGKGRLATGKQKRT